MSSVGESKSKNVAATKEEEYLQQSHQARKKNIKNAQKEEIDSERSLHKDRIAEMRDRHTSEVQKQKTTRQQLKENHSKMAQESYKKTAEERARHEAGMRQQKSQLQEKQNAYSEQEQSFEVRKQQEAQKSVQAFDTHMDEMYRAQKSEVDTQKKQHNLMTAEEHKKFEDHRKGQREFYDQEIKKEGDQFKDHVVNRRGEFDVEFNKNELNYQLVLAEQKQKYEEHFEKEKYKHLDGVKRFETPKQDPFYRVQDLGAQFEDKGSHYEVRLQIPEHELRNFKVHVKDDKITVSGARRHEEELKYEGEKLSTNNYQTIKQEFALSNPVDQDNVHKEYKDGTLFVSANKKGFGIFK